MTNKIPFWPGHKLSEIKDQSLNGGKIETVKKSINLKITALFIFLLILGIIVLYLLFK